MESGKEALEMAKARRHGLMEPVMLENGEIIRHMDMVSLRMWKVICMKGSGQMTRPTDMGFIYT